MARILIAEDDTGIRLLVARALRLEGHDVLVAEDGEMAVDILAEENGAFDLLLSDIRMPGMTGIELAHAAHATFPELPILLMTGYAEQKEAAEDLSAFILGVVEKPFTISEIRQRVAQALRGTAAGEAAVAPLRRYA
ncbi:response regulator [Aureimonas sp. AU22]|uniref:response regulator n=1 Tax=Aureimonas sp. AU22 TaxID=1638162 RepID=UPI000785FFAE|nr:response regulator [Aureimonas sp. AU22]